MALVEGVKYGLSSQVNQCGNNKTVIFVKLTDSALRAIEDYLKAQHKTGHRATLRFLGNEGNICIPSSTSDNGHNFDFSLSTNADIEGPQGSFECIQQYSQRSLESAGPLSYKMRIKANDDVFAQTQHRFNELENERRQECAKEIKSNCADIGRKVKKKIGMPLLPQRREKSPSYISHPPPPPPAKHSPVSMPSFANSANSHKLPNGFSSTNSSSTNRKVVNGICNGNNGTAAPGQPINGTGTKVANTSSAAQDVSRRPLKERLIHMLAVKPYKKPELWNRLHSDGLKDRDKKVLMTILQQVSSFKDNEYSLLRGVWNDVQEDWPFYSEQEKQLMKRRKPQNLTPPGSDSSVGSGGSSLSPRSTSSVGSGHSPTSYSSHTVHYSRSSQGVNGESKGLAPMDGGGLESAKGIKRPGILPDNFEDYGDIPHKKTRVSHFKRPSSGGSNSNVNGANASGPSRSELVVKHEKEGSNGLSPQFPSHSSRVAERLSPIGTTSGSNFSVQNGSGSGNGFVQNVNNHHSPRNGNFEPMDASPSHGTIVNNGFHSSSHGDTVLDESVSVGSSWQSRNGNDAHGLSDSEKARGDSDETDSVDSGNGSSASGSSNGSQHQHHNYSYSNSHGNNVNNSHGNYSNLKASGEKSESTASSTHNTNTLINGCNRVSSTTSFHTTPQSSPDSQVDTLHLQQKTQSLHLNAPTVIPSKHSNQRVNGKCNLDTNPNIEIIVTREKASDRDSHRDYRDRSRKNERERGKEKERDRGKEKERDGRNKRSSGSHGNHGSGDKKYTRMSDDHHHIDNGYGSPVKISSEYPSYLTKYPTITTVEQRSKYKEDFNAEYPEYRDLHAVIDKVSKRFAHLEERLRQEERGTEGYEKIKELIVNEYYANKRDKKYQETRHKFQYLHEKLSHIKRLVSDYDAHHQEADLSHEYTNGFRN